MEAETYLKELENEHSDVIKKSLLISAIIAYSRPFSNNEKHDKATNTIVGNPKKILEPTGYELHKKIISYRNKALAHSDYDMNRVISHTRDDNVTYTTINKFDILFERIDIDKFREIHRAMLNHALSMSVNLDRRISSNK